MIAIVDYGAGNIASVKNALDKLGVTSVVTRDQKIWNDSEGIIFPGVGSFGSAMKQLDQNSLVDSIREKPFLGICLGMQLLFEKSEESQNTSGLCLFKGKVKKFKCSLPVPHTGWNKVIVSDSPLFNGINDFYAYFVHSYYCDPIDKNCVIGSTVYGKKFPSAVSKGNIYATQFHPEKSGEIGLSVLKNFLTEVKK
ncbi:MAG: imidazole glycerol phosphate synthase subunit HisH [Candidatus Micrarchaeota archaeon]